ncbi:MAG: hypothetical protein AAFZ07_19005 [Actinomycetota bacterium]
MDVSGNDRHDEELHIVRILGDPTSRASTVHVEPDTTSMPSATADVEVVPILPGSAYDRGQPVSSLDL